MLTEGESFHEEEKEGIEMISRHKSTKRATAALLLLVSTA